MSVSRGCRAWCYLLQLVFAQRWLLGIINTHRPVSSLQGPALKYSSSGGVCSACLIILKLLSYVCILQVILNMDSEEIPTFSSPKEETAYWKELSLKYKQRYCCIFSEWIWFLVTEDVA